MSVVEGASRSLKAWLPRVGRRAQTGHFPPTGSFLRFDAEAAVERLVQIEKAATRRQTDRELLALLTRAKQRCSPKNPFRRTFEASVRMELALRRARLRHANGLR